MVANTAPITPVPTVAAVNNWRRLWSTSSFMRYPRAMLTNLHENPYARSVSLAM
jgi:hypothetical protein